ncbi:hypothetical protein WJX74_006085 [Apatococcus lobatus]|uniref:J domain-containing protein n=1 Tax=Apatococcus lobatus TaxID=904363 RepID=A0AAW1QJJ8_9CHLO
MDGPADVPMVQSVVLDNHVQIPAAENAGGSSSAPLAAKTTLKKKRKRPRILQNGALTLIVHGANEQLQWAQRTAWFCDNMRGILGDRTMTGRWGGSVLDSVIGAFLTQNASDVLSSKAWMTLQSRFPATTSLQQGPADGWDPQDRQDIIDWHAVRTSPTEQVADAIRCRGMHNNLAKRIQALLELLHMADPEHRSDSQGQMGQPQDNPISVLAAKSGDSSINASTRQVTRPNAFSNLISNSEACSQSDQPLTGSDNCNPAAEHLPHQHGMYSPREQDRRAASQAAQHKYAEKNPSAILRSMKGSYAGPSQYTSMAGHHISSGKASAEVMPTPLTPARTQADGQQSAPEPDIPWDIPRDHLLPDRVSTELSESCTPTAGCDVVKMQPEGCLHESADARQTARPSFSSPSAAGSVPAALKVQPNRDQAASSPARRYSANLVDAEHIRPEPCRPIKKPTSMSLDWLLHEDVTDEVAKTYLMEIAGLGRKSVACIMLLSLQRKDFPVDTNVGRICARLGWIPIEAAQALENMDEYAPEPEVHKYLHSRLMALSISSLYELHYQMITLGKVICTKVKPNCSACTLQTHCEYALSGGERWHSPAVLHSYRTGATDIEDAMLKGLDATPHKGIHVSERKDAHQAAEKPFLESSTHLPLEDLIAAILRRGLRLDKAIALVAHVGAGSDALRALDAALAVLGLTRQSSLAHDSFSQDAADGQISRCFRRISRRIHPDKCPHQHAMEAFDRLQQAQAYALEQLEHFMPKQDPSTMPDVAKSSGSVAPCTSSPRRLLRMAHILGSDLLQQLPKQLHELLPPSPGEVLAVRMPPSALQPACGAPASCFVLSGDSQHQQAHGASSRLHEGALHAHPFVTNRSATAPSLQHLQPDISSPAAAADQPLAQEGSQGVEQVPASPWHGLQQRPGKIDITDVEPDTPEGYAITSSEHSAGIGLYQHPSSVASSSCNSRNATGDVDAAPLQATTAASTSAHVSLDAISAEGTPAACHHLVSGWSQRAGSAVQAQHETLPASTNPSTLAVLALCDGLHPSSGHSQVMQNLSGWGSPPSHIHAGIRISGSMQQNRPWDKQPGLPSAHLPDEQYPTPPYFQPGVEQAVSYGHGTQHAPSVKHPVAPSCAVGSKPAVASDNETDTWHQQSAASDNTLRHQPWSTLKKRPAQPVAGLSPVSFDVRSLENHHHSPASAGPVLQTGAMPSELLESMEPEPGVAPSSLDNTAHASSDSASAAIPHEPNSGGGQSGQLDNAFSKSAHNDLPEVPEGVRFVLLIPCRAALHNRFPLNGTYFQTNEMFLLEATVQRPLLMPEKVWSDLPQRAVYFGSAASAICRGMRRAEVAALFASRCLCIRGINTRSGCPTELPEWLKPSPASPTPRKRRTSQPAVAEPASLHLPGPCSPTHIRTPPQPPLAPLQSPLVSCDPSPIAPVPQHQAVPVTMGSNMDSGAAALETDGVGYWSYSPELSSTKRPSPKAEARPLSQQPSCGLTKSKGTSKRSLEKVEWCVCGAQHMGANKKKLLANPIVLYDDAEPGEGGVVCVWCTAYGSQ